MTTPGEPKKVIAGDSSQPGPASSVIRFDPREFPWWLAAMLALIGAMIVAIVLSKEYRQAFAAILPIPVEPATFWIPLLDEPIRIPVDIFKGLGLTVILTAGAFVAAMILGLVLGLWRISRNPFLRNLASMYIEFVRGIPVIVFVFAVALVLVPDFADFINVPTRAISNAWRGLAALSLFYAAFIAEVFRAGIQSVDIGQTEAGRAIGLSERQIMRRVILPQAVRNMLPALGNDLISLMKDTSLLSVLAVRELTQQARLYSGSTFRFRQAFFITMVIYVVLTLSLSLLLRWYERRIAIPRG